MKIHRHTYTLAILILAAALAGACSSSPTSPSAIAPSATSGGTGRIEARNVNGSDLNDFVAAPGVSCDSSAPKLKVGVTDMRLDAQVPFRADAQKAIFRFSRREADNDFHLLKVINIDGPGFATAWTAPSTGVYLIEAGWQVCGAVARWTSAVKGIDAPVPPALVEEYDGHESHWPHFPGYGHHGR